MTEPTAGEGENTWSRLRRRKVVQWSLAYVAGAWALLQGVDFLVDAFHWPSSAKQIATLAFAVGLPVAVVLAWYHGDRGQHRVGGVELTVLAVLLALGGFLLWRYEPAVETPTTATGAAPELAGVPADPKSIAVLPFADMSAAKDQEYMSDGMAEELLNLLAKSPDLKVIARTSSFAFKGKDVDIAEIARKLNVAYVLEGSVRTSGKTIRVTAQLVRASDSTHLWSETYDRELTDIFRVQDEIADAVAQALQIKLAGGSLNRREGGTQNLEAYQLYLRAMIEDRNTELSTDVAVNNLEKAINLDPAYGMAWFALADIYSDRADNGWVAPSEGFGRSRELALHALQLSPALAEAHAELQYIHLTFDWDWASAASEQAQALAIDPTSPWALQVAGMLSRTLGRWDDSERQLRASLVRNPLSSSAIWNLGLTYYLAGRFEDSELTYRQLLAIEPDFLWTRAYLAKTLLAQGKVEEALATVQLDPDEGWRLVRLPIVLQAAGHQAEAEEALDAQIAQWADTGAYVVAQTYAYRGEHDRALEWLERAYRQKDASLVEITGEPLFKNMADDPRFKAFLRKMNLPELLRPSTKEPRG